MTARDTGTSRSPVRERRTARTAAVRGAGRREGGCAAPQHGSPGGRDRSRRRERERRRPPFWLAFAASAVVLAVALVAAVWIRLDGDITSFSAGGESKNRPPAGQPGENILLLGSDSRAGGNRAFAGGTGAIGRSDTAILLHVYGDHRHALGVSLPRDSLVTIPPCLLPDGRWSPTRYDTPFNAAFSTGDSPKGNPACTQNTVEALTGLRVDHTVVVDFAGFAAMTDALHGVPVCVPSDIYQGDIDPGLGGRGRLVFAKGPQTVSGTKALDYVRLRHGIGDGSDIGRTQRQQAFIAGMIRKIRAQGADPATLLPLADAATRSLTVDPGLDSAGKLLSFAESLQGISLDHIQFVTAPWAYAGEKIALVHPDVDTLWAALRADRTLSGQNASGHPVPASPSAPASAGAGAPVDGGGAAVAVYNGTTVPGLAARYAAVLRGDGFTVTGTATAVSQAHRTTLVEYDAAHHDAAAAVARALPGARLLAVPGAGGVAVVLGADRIAGAGPGSAGGAGPADGGGAGASAPAALPAADAANARTAAEDPCADLSYGTGG